MKTKKLHIISFDIPYPANYGGIIDVFYKIKALHQIGVEITLHCFQYGGKEQQAALLNYCKEVFYYPRNTFMNPFLGKLPYIVKTRNSRTLFERIQADNNPILFEGLHSCYWLNDLIVDSRITLVRNHNIEGDYYNHLARVEQNPIKRRYFIREAKLLNAFEPIIAKATKALAISPSDHDLLNARYGNSEYLPVFHSNSHVVINQNKEPFCLYHGNLSVGENDEAACYLVEHVFNHLPYKLVLAGNNPSERLKGLVNENGRCELKSKLSVKEIDELIGKAFLNVLPTFQATGIKLKLLNALHRGGHCLVNNEMVEETGLESLCFIANSAVEMKDCIAKLFNSQIEVDYGARREILASFN
ncbi:MAG: mannosyltransferase, partial [Bacteroidetes bacterium]|nr:mannosyltransferase [Bacteroidota bacterium]